MSSLSPKDRVSLCSFTFADGHRCRTPRTGKIPISASTTPKKKPAPAPQNRSAKTWPTSSPANTFPPAISAPITGRLIAGIADLQTVRNHPSPNSFRCNTYRSTRKC
jgi:hypothetical protein